MNKSMERALIAVPPLLAAAVAAVALELSASDQPVFDHVITGKMVSSHLKQLAYEAGVSTSCRMEGAGLAAVNLNYDVVTQIEGSANSTRGAVISSVFKREAKNCPKAVQEVYSDVHSMQGAEGALVDSIEGISTLRETNANQSSVRMFEGAIRQAIEHHSSLLQSPTIVGNVG